MITWIATPHFYKSSKLITTKHKVRVRLADFGAVKQQPNVISLGMFATHL
jgi:hypothetical protein